MTGTRFACLGWLLRLFERERCCVPVYSKITELNMGKLTVR